MTPFSLFYQKLIFRLTEVVDMKLFLLAAIPMILLSGMSLVQAQPGPPIDDAAAKKRIEEFRKIKLIAALDLTEEQAVRLFVREKDFRAVEGQLTKKRKKQVEGLKTLIHENAGDEALKNELLKLSELSKQIVQQRYDFRLSLNDILSMKQIARLIVFDSKFAHEIKRMILNRARRGQRHRPD